MHTDHSHDCATPVEVLLATARDRGLGAIAVTDHNEISGALDARAKAAEYGVKVIVGEEVKTADQGEVIGLFIEEKIPRGMTLEETIAEIRRQGGLVYVPHPFDRMHSVPDYEHLLDVVDDIDAIEVFNPRIAIPAFNEEAVRFAAKYRIVGGAGSDAHVAQGLGSVRIRMRDFDGPEEFLESLRDADIIGKPSSLRYAQVQALKFLQTKATPTARPRGHAPAQAWPGRSPVAARVTDAGARRTGARVKPVGGMPATDDEIREKYLERAIRELNHFTRELQALRPLPARQPDAGARLRPPAGRRVPAQVRADAGGDRGGRRVLRARRHRADEVAAAARHRSAGRLRHAVREVPGRRHRAGRAGVHRAPGRGDRDRAAEDRRGHGPGGARRAQRAASCRWPARCSSERRRASSG